LAANVEYEAHRFVDKQPIAAEIRSNEYCRLHKKNCNYIGFCWDKI
jgi:hypothetical protein